MTPATQSIPRGTSTSVLIDGLSGNTPQTISLQSLDASVATVASTVLAPAGVRSVSVDVKAVGVGGTQIVATLPPALGGSSLSANVTVFDGTGVVFDPRSLTVPLDKTANVRVSLQPSLSAPVTLTIAGNSKLVEVPSVLTIPAGGSALLPVKGIKLGGTAVNVTLPLTNGGTSFALLVDIIDPAATLSVSTVSPATGTEGGGTAVVISGTQLRADCEVRFGDSVAAVTAADATTLNVVTPPHAPGSVDVIVSCGNATASLPNAFTYFSSAPAITQVTPSFGSTNGGTLVRVTGSNFTSSCWPFLDGAPARGAIVRGGNEIVASTPAHAAGSVTVAVRCDTNREASLAKAFSYVQGAEPSPVITSVTPLAASAGQTVVIGGAWLNRTDTVLFDSFGAPILSFAPDAIAVRVPEVPVGRASVIVTDGAGHLSTTGPIFTVLEAQTPQITSVSPLAVAPGNEVTIEGTGFRGVYTFAFGESPATVVTSTYTRAVVRVPPMAPGVVQLNMLNASGRLAVIGPSVTVAGAGISIASASQQCAGTDGGAAIVLRGTGFVTGARVAFDERAAASAQVVDGQTLNVTLPPLAAGTPTIIVTNPNGDRATLTNALRVYSPFDPDSLCSTRTRAVRH
jgi:hypothetical protein